MKINGRLCAWLAVGLYGSIAAIGGDIVCAFLAVFCGFMAGLAKNKPLQPNK